MIEHSPNNFIHTEVTMHYKLFLCLCACPCEDEYNKQQGDNKNGQINKLTDKSYGKLAGKLTSVVKVDRYILQHERH